MCVRALARVHMCVCVYIHITALGFFFLFCCCLKEQCDVLIYDSDHRLCMLRGFT